MNEGKTVCIECKEEKDADKYYAPEIKKKKDLCKE
jgi:hypothetical protein